MKEVNVKREKILEIVRTNREEHKQIFKEAQEGFKEALLERLEEMKEAATTLYPEVDVELQVPIHHLNDYDRIISMLELSTDMIITLDAKEFNQYIMDDWFWQEDWLVINSPYSRMSEAKSITYTTGRPNPGAWTNGC